MPEKAPLIQIYVGSLTDKQPVIDSGMLNILQDVGVSWSMSVFSADRHPEELQRHCREAGLAGTKVFIGIAAMAAVLPGAVSATINGQIPVIGVALPSSEFPDGMDAVLSMIRKPTGVPVLCAGVGKHGLCNAAIAACSILATSDKLTLNRLQTWRMRWRAEKPTVPELVSSETYKA